jgi:CPA2 family monovalent cation:H+ antiporter-2
MTASHDLGLYRETLVFLGTAGIIIPLMARFHISPVLGFLGAGMALGPHGLGRLAEMVPAVGYVTILSQDAIDRLGELGVVFLLFTIGLELSFDRLRTMRRLVFGFGLLQVVVTTLAIGAVALAFNRALGPSLVIGACLALSSTAIVLQLLAEQRRLSTRTGRTVFAVLLAQDLAVVPMLFLVALLGGTAVASGPLASFAGGSVLVGLLIAVVQAAVAVVLILAIGHVLLKPLLRLVARTRNRELFMAATLFVLFGAALLTQAAGLSMALGAFLAGLLLSDTEFRREIEVEVDAFKGLLLGLFFMSVGMRVDLAGALREPLLVALSAVGMIGVKAAIIAALARAYRVAWPVAIEAGLLLAGGGEFAFLLLGLGRSSGLIGAPVESFMLLVTATTMLLTPALASIGRSAGRRVRHVAADAGGFGEAPPAAAGVTLVIGYGRVGRLVAGMLSDAGEPFLAVDRNADVIAAERRADRRLVYGDASRREFLTRCGLAEARAVVVTMDDPVAAEHVVAAVRAERSDLPLIVRARDAAHAERLFRLGATDVVPETVEASLDLASTTLKTLGGAHADVDGAIAAKRAALMAPLRAAAASRVR